MTVPPRLDMRGVTRQFAGGAGVQDISFSVSPGEVVCLLGPSGCGKSTTLRIAAGVERAGSGEVLVDGIRFQAPGCWVPPEKRGVGLMFQDYALFPHLSVLRNVMFGLDALPRAKAHEIALAGLDRVGLRHLASAYPHVLSGGEQQRVALARAMAPGPKLMLMDEPFSGLDERLRDEVRARTMGVLSDAGAAALVVTHDPEEAMAIANRIVLLRKGRVVQIGSPVELYANPVDLDAAAFFSPHTVFTGHVRTGRLRTPLGEVAASFADGRAATAAFRPEAIMLAGSEGKVARVVGSRQVGPDTILRLALSLEDGGDFIATARMRLDRPPKMGDVVNAAPDLTRVLVFPAG